MRHALLALLLLLGVPMTASAGISIGISIAAYPHFVAVPGYPVYYAPDLDSNYFFYDGLYWVYDGDAWYSSGWYDGPWDVVDPFRVPVYLLQVPVRYYRRPPLYFRGWRADHAPRWGEHWGHDWDRRRVGWDRPRPRIAPAPLPDYQQRYRGATYPRGEQQRVLRDQNYRFRPAEPGRPPRGDAQHGPRPAPQPMPSPRRMAPPERMTSPQRMPAPERMNSPQRMPAPERMAPPHESRQPGARPQERRAPQDRRGPEDRRGPQDRGRPDR